MDLHLRDKAFIVTGATSGLGQATAVELALNGAQLVLNARSQESLAATVQILVAAGVPESNLRTVEGSIGTPEVASQLTTAALEHFGRLNGALISVGGPTGGLDSTISDDQWLDAFSTVFLGMRRVARATAEAMTTGGSIALVLSSTVHTPIAGIATSNGLRPGLAMLVKQMSVEYGPRGIRFNSLLPGRFDTERVRFLDAQGGDPNGSRQRAEAGIPLRRYGEPSEFGAFAAFILSERASYLTGASIDLDGGARPSV
ncbi:MAG: SDR family oxidoreductase [Actinobacteria bacterium]|nr:SDR family oxidoreductase [Actinomycetota bacterium]